MNAGAGQARDAGNHSQGGGAQAAGEADWNMGMVEGFHES